MSQEFLYLVWCIYSGPLFACLSLVTYPMFFIGRLALSVCVSIPQISSQYHFIGVLSGHFLRDFTFILTCFMLLLVCIVCSTKETLELYQKKYFFFYKFRVCFVGFWIINIAGSLAFHSWNKLITSVFYNHPKCLLTVSHCFEIMYIISLFT